MTKNFRQDIATEATKRKLAGCVTVPRAKTFGFRYVQCEKCEIGEKREQKIVRMQRQPGAQRSGATSRVQARNAGALPLRLFAPQCTGYLRLHPTALAGATASVSLRSRLRLNCCSVYHTIEKSVLGETSMRHKNKQGISYSVFPFGSSRQMLLVGEPAEHYTCQNDVQGQGQTVPDYPRQIRSLLEQCRDVCEKEGFAENMTVMCHFFIANIGMQELVRQLALEIFPETIFGACTIVPQAPASGAVIALELWVVNGNRSLYEPAMPGEAALAEFDDMRWFFGGGYRPETYLVGAYDRSLDAFDCLAAELILREFKLNQILRTWIYQGHLVLPEGETQRYKELNRARTDVFGKTQFLKKYLPKTFQGTVYPASTGIGADDVDVVISAIALDTKRKDVIVVPLENPNQTSAFDYGAAYSPQSPKFSRAMAVAVAGECIIFVSGTASIIDSESQHIEDPTKQTEQTLDNIAALIAGENLDRHGIADIACGLGNLECVRVYVKRPSELALIRQVCERRLPEIPILYTIADVCRPELLVEIEGIALARRE